MATNEVSVEADKITTIQGSPTYGASTPSTTSDLDDDYQLYKRGDDQELDVAESKKVLRKLDRRIVPILFFIYLLQYLDKNGINYASVYGLQKGTNLHGQNYNWLGSIFYFGTFTISSSCPEVPADCARLFVGSISCWLPSAKTPSWQSNWRDHRDMGYHFDHDSCLLKLCGHRCQSLSVGQLRGGRQSWFCSHNEYMVHVIGAAIKIGGILLHEWRSNHVWRVSSACHSTVMQC